MNWSDTVSTTRYTDRRKLAKLMALMWETSARLGNEVLLSNLECNTFDSFGLASSLDWAGIPVPENLQL